MKKSRSGRDSKSGFKSIILGAAVIWCLFIVLSLVFTVVLFSGENPTGSTALFSLISFIASGGLGTLLNKKLFKSCEMNAPLFSALLSAAVYLVISAISSGRISIGCLINTLCFVLISLLFSVARKKKNKRYTH